MFTSSKMTDVLIEHERLETTEHKAKALKIWIEPMVKWATRIKFDQTNDRGILLIIIIVIIDGNFRKISSLTIKN